MCNCDWLKSRPNHGLECTSHVISKCKEIPCVKFFVYILHGPIRIRQSQAPWGWCKSSGRGGSVIDNRSTLTTGLAPTPGGLCRQWRDWLASVHDWARFQTNLHIFNTKYNHTPNHYKNSPISHFGYSYLLKNARTLTLSSRNGHFNSSFVGITII